jgi:hypothetical protein
MIDMREKPIATQLFDEDKTGEDDLGMNPLISGAWGYYPDDDTKGRWYFGLVDAKGVESIVLARDDLIQHIGMMKMRAQFNSSRMAMVYLVRLKENQAKRVAELRKQYDEGSSPYDFRTLEYIEAIPSFDPLDATGAGLKTDTRKFKRLKALMSVEREEYAEEIIGLGIMNYRDSVFE